MGNCRNLCWVLLIALFLVNLSCLAIAQPYDYPIANLSTTWINSPSAPHSVNFTDGSTVRATLLRGTFGPRFACGFYCSGTCEAYFFAIFIVQTNSVSFITSPGIGFPQVVWSANRNNPVRINATLELTSDGDLLLRDADGSLAWSTNTSGMSVAGLNLTDMGNLVLFDRNHQTVWDSFDYPTDSLVPGQKLAIGQKLTASVSATNSSQGLTSLTVFTQGLFALIESSPPQVYYHSAYSGVKVSKEPSYVRFLNGSLSMFILNSEPSDPDGEISIPVAASAQYMKLESTGHLKVYEWGTSWKEVADLLTGYLGECAYPMVCGENDICSNQQCSCPTSPTGEATYFNQINDRQPDLGCSEITPLSCADSQHHDFVELRDVTYFTFSADYESTDSESCKQACLKNCSCKGVIFRYGSNSFSGECYLPSKIFSLMNNEKDKTNYNSITYLKVQKVPTAAPPGKTTNRLAPILGSSIGALVGLFVVIVGIWVFYVRKNKNVEEEEDQLDQVPGMIVRFSYEDLKTMTDDFSKKLGQGGFGSVFEGILTDGTKIAVKHLEGLVQIKKSFLAEVETIGSIHHVNLVRLIGFCAEKSHRLLVYEYMSNGSLEKWIFHKNDNYVLHWQHRKKIILDIAKGLTYLHEDCRQKIVHLDIKPQNILLDENFNAKVADFGMSKLVDRDQSQIVTTMRGTPGYLAPEWLNSIITEKVDVYSFGVVILEILCGRKNLDQSQPEESQHLLTIFRIKAEEKELLDMVDKYSEDMQLHGDEVVKTMKVAAWCLQGDYSKRPAMSTVVKVLEGVIDIKDDIDYSFYNPAFARKMVEVGLNEGSATALLPSVLSGPR